MKNPHLHNNHLDASPIFHLGNNTGVCLLHGFTATPFEVKSLANFLVEKGFSVDAPLLAGHGTEPRDMFKITWKDWVATAENSLSRLSAHCDRVIIGGESTGGLLALYMAAKHPEIAGVLAFSPALKLPITGFDKFVIKYLSWMIKTTSKNDLGGNTTWQGYRVNPLNGVKQLITLQNETRKVLQDINQPVLVFMGGEDKTIDLSSGKTVIEGISSDIIDYHFYEEGEHCILLWSGRDEVMEITWNFLTSTFKIQ